MRKCRRTTRLGVQQLIFDQHAPSVLALANLIVEHLFCCERSALSFDQFGVEQAASVAQCSDSIGAPSPFGRLCSAAPMALVVGFVDHLRHHVLLLDVALVEHRLVVQTGRQKVQKRRRLVLRGRRRIVQVVLVLWRRKCLGVVVKGHGRQREPLQRQT